MKKVKLVVSSGQYEEAAEIVTITCTTLRGFLRRVDQLKKQHAVYGDNWAGYIDASVAIASDNDVWSDNTIIGGQNCRPKYGWIMSDNDIERYDMYDKACTYREVAKILGF